MKHKADVAKQALNSRSGRPIPLKDIEQYQQLEQKKNHEVMLVRFRAKDVFKVDSQLLHTFRFRYETFVSIQARVCGK